MIRRRSLLIATHGYTKVTPATIYTDGLGSGLEPGSKDTLKDDFLTSDQPFYFSVKVPEESNYRVRVTPE